jgi:hypothetical protein
MLEHKDDLKARGKASPDDGDPLAMTFAVKVAPKPKLGTPALARTRPYGPCVDDHVMRAKWYA